jgi:methionine synthase II (cobalamin-independent)
MPEPKPFATTAIGSVPYGSAAEALANALKLDIPAAPQLVKISFWEDMFWSALAGLPALLTDPAQRKVRAKRHRRENDLADFYARFLAGERDFLALPPEAGLGFEAFLQQAAQNPAFGPEFLKIQVIGPVTLGQMIQMEDGESALIDDPELREAMALGLGGKAAWEAARVRALGRTPVVFIDEPGLTSFGSAFSNLSADTVKETMNRAGAVVREDGPALIGCHVCGNTDWAMMMETDLDIINFDAFAVLEQFCLYPKQIRAFLERGGFIAWGIVPAAGFSLNLSSDFLARKLLDAWEGLEHNGVPGELLAGRALITTACGLGTLPEDLARAATEMTSSVSRILQERRG